VSKEETPKPHQKAWHRLELASVAASRLLGVACTAQAVTGLFSSSKADPELLLVAGLMLLGLPAAQKLFQSHTSSN
jgi:uncharacterized membrane protein AbrB (regulator of aidB expression)